MRRLNCLIALMTAAMLMLVGCEADPVARATSTTNTVTWKNWQIEVPRDAKGTLKDDTWVGSSSQFDLTFTVTRHNGNQLSAIRLAEQSFERACEEGDLKVNDPVAVDLPFEGGRAFLYRGTGANSAGQKFPVIMVAAYKKDWTGIVFARVKQQTRVAAEWAEVSCRSLRTLK